jgi:erythromycin esterase
MRRNILILALLLATLVLPTAAQRRRASAPPSEAQLSAEAWLRVHAIPFETVEPGGADDDLLVLAPLAAEARVVELGEATHASHEFFAMKRRMFEFLVRHKGFTVFSIEATLADCDRINDYVVDGKGDPSALLKELGYWVWNTDEVLALIQWMRAYNASRGGAPVVSFRGFDAQTPRYTAQALATYLGRVDPANAVPLMQRYQCYQPYELNPAAYARLPLSSRDACQASLVALHDAVAERRTAYSAASSAADFERMLRYARTLVQAEAINGERAAINPRDELMAENIAWIANVEHPGEKVVVWAHNGHVAAEEPYQMGSFLRRLYCPGEAMVIFGFAFDRGSFHAYDYPQGRTRQVYTVDAPEDGYEAFFATAGQPRMFVDVRHASSVAARELFESRQKTMWEIGAAYSEAQRDVFRPPLVLAKNFDVVIWIETVTPTSLR